MNTVFLKESQVLVEPPSTPPFPPETWPQPGTHQVPPNLPFHPVFDEREAPTGVSYREVVLWGTVVEHELGWRAQYAFPRSFHLPLEMLPVNMRMLEPRLKTLAAYGCDIHVIGKQGNVPLWVRSSGYDVAALDLLVQRCKNWYERRQQERQIKRGDRVAILGRGIAVVEQVNDTHVLVLLWNRTALRIRRKEIVWDEQNMRWEAGG